MKLSRGVGCHRDGELLRERCVWRRVRVIVLVLPLLLELDDVGE